MTAKKPTAPARTPGVDTTARAGAVVLVSDPVHMMTPNMTALCRNFSFRGMLLKTDVLEHVTCPKCIQLIKKRKLTCRKAAQ